MRRSDFIKLIRLRSRYKIDRRVGNYEIANGQKLNTYIQYLVESQLKLDGLWIRENGDLCNGSGGDWNETSKEFDDYTLTPLFEKKKHAALQKWKDASMYLSMKLYSNSEA